MKKTKWFVAKHQPPVRPGLYEVRNSPGDPIRRCRYDNGSWRDWAGKPVFFGLWFEDNQWRGLTTKDGK